MRKTVVSSRQNDSIASVEGWLDIDKFAQVEISSEDPACPIENALIPGRQGGWLAADPGEQTIRLTFDQPQRINRARLLFLEETAERRQEFVLRWSSGIDEPWREIVRQQYHFSPSGATRQMEEYQVGADGVRMIELRIIPDGGANISRASLAELRLA